jgi:hypothetical protein
MAAGGHLHFDNEPNVSTIEGNPALNKMTPVGVRRSNVYEIYVARYHICFVN